jgi:DNA-directed RNA polymerase specialized sigma24 family protein
VHNELDRKMLIRRYLDGLSVLETAEQFNFSYKQCYKRISAAKKQLFKHIKVVDDNVEII